ncbi:MAG: hypothetical protein M3Z20_07610 [Chloroflexota bacterium]|nr:hypothetical protein [Chloroflexota bacterium]
MNPRAILRASLGALLLAVLAGPVAGDTHPQQAAASELQCDVAPRSYANITSLLDVAPPATPPATTGGETLESGIPATDSEVHAMRNLVGEWLACQNEGKLFSSWALFSDGYLYRLISRQPPLSSELYDDWATPAPAESATATLLTITDERRLDDGRLGATVRISYASVPMPKQFFFYFVERDGTLLIDSILGEISFSVP